MSKHHSDLIMCRKTTGIGLGSVCSYCEDKCIICDSYVELKKRVRLCEECNFGIFGERCVVCNGEGISPAFYCKKCCLLEKDRDGCPKIINISASRKDRYILKKTKLLNNEN